MANKHLKRWSTSDVIKKMEIKTTMRYHYTLTRKATIWNTDNIKHEEDVEQQKHSFTAGGNAKWYYHFGRQFGGFFFFFINLFIYLFIFSCVGSSFLCKGFL